MIEALTLFAPPSIFFGTEDQPGGSCLIDCARFHFFEHMHIWFVGNDAREPSDGGVGRGSRQNKRRCKPTGDGFGASAGEAVTAAR